MSQARLEAQILCKFERAFDKAVDEHEYIAQEDVDEIGRQKLLLNAIRHFDLDHLVTTSWYKDGDVLTELDNYQSEVTATNAGVEDGPIPEMGDIIEYFHDDESGLSLAGVFDIDDRKEWLRGYYEGHGKLPFESIYITGLKIHLHIRNISKACLQNDGVYLPDRLVSPVTNATDDLKSEMNREPLFRNIPPYVTEFERVAETILSAFESRYQEDDLRDWVGVFDQLNKFYFNTTWEAIAARIAFYKADGPSETRSRMYRKGTLNVARQNFSAEFDQLQDECRSVGVELEAQTDRVPDLEKELGSTDDFLEMTATAE